MRCAVLLGFVQEAFYGKEVVVADREMVESEADRILYGADREDVAFLVVGDPFGCAEFQLSCQDYTASR